MSPSESPVERTIAQEESPGPLGATVPATDAPASVDFSQTQSQVSDLGPHWPAGYRIGDWSILRILGQGSFGTVYLAQQISLDRLVALKVSDSSGRSEGIALAGLEHDHIVKVYSEFSDPKTRKHCLCLQYVPGTTLSKLIAYLHRHQDQHRSGTAFLNAIEKLGQGEAKFDPLALRDRDRLAKTDFVQTICQIGSQLADALAFAHSQGVLHCDVKPGNILVTHYGRPMLVDFNVAFDHVRASVTDRPQGGTLAYMPPEQMAPFVVKGGSLPEVDERADIYSLGMVLFELTTGKLPFIDDTPNGNNSIREIYQQRLDAKKVEEVIRTAGLPKVLMPILLKCLHPSIEERYFTAEELALALRNAADLHRVEKALPSSGLLGRWAQQYPIRTLTLLTLIPHIVASGLNIAYNTIEIDLVGEQKEIFRQVVMGYNLVVYPLCLLVAIRLILDLQRKRRKSLADTATCEEDINSARQRILSLGNWGIALSLIGWLPGGLFFPLMIDALAGPLPWRIYAHFMISFTLSGLIGMMYSHFGLQFVVLRSLYSESLHPDCFHPERVRADILRSSRFFSWFQILTAIVPLVGVALLVIVEQREMTLSFRLLVISLLLLSMFGVSIGTRITQWLNQFVQTWNQGLAHVDTQIIVKDSTTSQFVPIRRSNRFSDRSRNRQ